VPASGGAPRVITNSFRAGAPRQLFAGVFNWRTEAGMNYAIDPTTGRFLMILPSSAPSEDAVTAIRVIAHWQQACGHVGWSRTMATATRYHVVACCTGGHKWLY
jgi:hypothetical protein